MENMTLRQLIGQLQSLLKARELKTPPLKVYIDYIKAEREGLELLIFNSEDQRMVEQVKTK